MNVINLPKCASLLLALHKGYPINFGRVSFLEGVF